METKDSYKVGLYLRLSRDDHNNELESMSIANQRDLLITYVKERGWEVEETYADDGYTGTNFERPAFKRMIGDIKKGRIDMVITKDLSRLGRNYVRVGEYTDFFFPQHQVRYLAITENIDTAKDNDIAGFLNIVNEHYAKDISRKVKAVRDAKAKQGKFMGSQPPYGYLKTPEDKNLLIVDPKASTIVKRIFECFAKGESARYIAQRLTSEGVSTPREYYYQRIGKPNPYTSESGAWGSASIMTMLRNQVYIGNMVQGKRKAPSFKIKKRYVQPEQNWVIVDNTHEAIIDLVLWDNVQAILAKHQNKQRNRMKSNGTKSLFSGKVICEDCGGVMAYTKITGTGAHKTYATYRCRRNGNGGNKSCSFHSVHEADLVAIIDEDLKQFANLAKEDEQALIKRLRRIGATKQEEDALILRLEIQDVKRRLEKVKASIKVLIDDRADGNLSTELFKQMIGEYEKDQSKLNDQMLQLKASLLEEENETDSIMALSESFKRYFSLEKLDRLAVCELIDKITVSKRYEVDGVKHQDITIYYNFIGNISEQKEIDQKDIQATDKSELSA